MVVSWRPEGVPLGSSTRGTFHIIMFQINAFLYTILNSFLEPILSLNRVQQ